MGGRKKRKNGKHSFQSEMPWIQIHAQLKTLGPHLWGFTHLLCKVGMLTTTSRTPERKESLKRLEIRFVKSSAQWVVHRRPSINRTTITIAQTKAVYIHDYYKIIIIIKLKHHSYIVCNIFGSESTSLII